MTKNVLVGVSGKARKANKIYVGVGNKARRVTAMYIGVNGIARKCWPNSRIPDPSYVEVDYIWTHYRDEITIDVFPNLNTRVVIDIEMEEKPRNSWLVDASFCIGYDDSEESDIYSGYTVSLAQYGFIFENMYDRSTTDSDAFEGILLNNRYRLDLNNNKKFYIYSNVGYYSNSSHNLVTTMNMGTTQSIRNKYMYIGWGSYFKIYGMQIYNGSTLVGDYVPSERVSDGVSGLYNITQNHFLT